MIGTLVLVALIALVVSMLLSPIETLGWWAGWYGHGLEDQRQSVSTKPDSGMTQGAEHYLIYLDGIANVGQQQYRDVEGLLANLRTRLPHVAIISDVMPYSVLDLPLMSAERPMARWWRRMFKNKVNRSRAPLSFTINLRNLFQVLVAADPRYGRIFGQGQAQVMLNALLKAGYRPGSGVPITILGYSGGAQVGLAATPFLKRALNAPVAMISLAGVMASEPGLDWLDLMYHVQSPTDSIPAYGRVLFPGRWRIMRNSHWNKMVRSDRLRFINMGPMRHNGPGSYLDESVVKYGESNLDRTTDVVVRLVQEIQHHLCSTDGVRATQAANEPTAVAAS